MATLLITGLLFNVNFLINYIEACHSPYPPQTTESDNELTTKSILNAYKRSETDNITDTIKTLQNKIQKQLQKDIAESKQDSIDEDVRLLRDSLAKLLNIIKNSTHPEQIRVESNKQENDAFTEKLSNLTNELTEILKGMKALKTTTASPDDKHIKSSTAVLDNDSTQRWLDNFEELFNALKQNPLNVVNELINASKIHTRGCNDTLCNILGNIEKIASTYT